VPIKSKAQRRKFAQLLIEGKITPETYEEWNRTAGKKKLPERLHPKARAKAKAKRKKVKSRRKTTSKRARKTTTKRAKTRGRTAHKRA
jgi:hypothetical protein